MSKTSLLHLDTHSLVDCTAFSSRGHSIDDNGYQEEALAAHLIQNSPRRAKSRKHSQWTSPFPRLLTCTQSNTEEHKNNLCSPRPGIPHGKGHLWFALPSPNIRPASLKDRPDDWLYIFLLKKHPAFRIFWVTFLYLLVYSADGALREKLATTIWAKKCQRLTFTGGDEERQDMRDREAGKGPIS